MSIRAIKVTFVIVLISIAALAQTSAEKVQKMADLFFSAYNQNEYASIESQFDAHMIAAIPADSLKAFLDKCQKEFGKFVKLGAPKFLTQSAAVFPAEFEKAKLELTISVDDEGKISGLRLNPPEPVKPPNTSRNKTVFRLPLKGEWFIFWGGDTLGQNYHQGAPTQRFAFDILKVDETGKTHRGEGKQNEDYFAFGQEIVADADGVVTDVIVGVKDNVPAVMNPLMAIGNMVMIRHANGEISVFCHLKNGSTLVKVGDIVKAGQTLGLVGNTGNSSEPHLHFQVQGTTLFEDENSMKVFFEKLTVKRDGKTEEKADYSPVKGDIVSQNQ